jgi:ABC-type branched-subunit amino acid transport system ATPase component
MALCGELKPDRGTIGWRGRPAPAGLHQRSRRGLGFVGDDRSIFRQLTVAQNLRVGRCDQARVLKLAPELEPHLHRRAGLLSGGQQQILAITRALARSPAALLADELSLGLAPMVVDRLLAILRRAADDGLGVVLVEQQISKALKVADRVYVLQQGQIAFEGTASEARRQAAAIEAAYLAGSFAGHDPLAEAPSAT